MTTKKPPKNERNALDKPGESLGADEIVDSPEGQEEAVDWYTRQQAATELGITAYRLRKCIADRPELLQDAYREVGKSGYLNRSLLNWIRDQERAAQPEVAENARVVSFSELQRLLGCGVETLQRLMEEHPAQPEEIVDGFRSRGQTTTGYTDTYARRLQMYHTQTEADGTVRGRSGLSRRPRTSSQSPVEPLPPGRLRPSNPAEPAPLLSSEDRQRRLEEGKDYLKRLEARQRSYRGDSRFENLVRQWGLAIDQLQKENRLPNGWNRLVEQAQGYLE